MAGNRRDGLGGGLSRPQISNLVVNGTSYGCLLCRGFAQFTVVACSASRIIEATRAALGFEIWYHNNLR
jgi:hypothetical protein